MEGQKLVQRGAETRGRWVAGCGPLARSFSRRARGKPVVDAAEELRLERQMVPGRAGPREVVKAGDPRLGLKAAGHTVTLTSDGRLRVELAGFQMRQRRKFEARS